MDTATAFAHLREIFTAGLQSVDAYGLLRDHLRLEGGTLFVREGAEPLRFELDRFERVLVLGAGKAGARMAQAVEEVLGDRLTAGVVAVKAGPGAAEGPRRIRLIEAGHPVPDAHSVEAGREIARLAREGDGRTLFVNLISGGGSALLSAPLEWEDRQGRLGLTLQDKQETTRLLLACGAAIQEINCLRKHLSAVKGGRLARLMAPGESLNLILSDVVGDRLDTIASGLTVPDGTTWADAQAIVRRYGLEERLPSAVRSILEAGRAGRLPDTPKEGDAAFRSVHNVLIGTNRSALLAARERAERLGYRTRVLTSRLTGEAREMARLFSGIGRDIRHHSLLEEPPACVLAGGETTVTLRGDGQGGRNQELALSFLAELAADPDASRGLYFLSASTDGSDGPTDATGAFASLEVLESARAAGLDLESYLRRNDSYAYFDRVGRLYRTGPTGTNVCDLQILLVP